MKNTFRYMLAACAIVVATSCAQELEDPNAIPEQDVELVPMTITVGGEMTKTTVGNDGKTINWCEEDEIAIFDGTAQRKFTIVDGTVSGSTATFTGMVAAESTDLYAVYPHDAAVSFAEGMLTATVSASQTLATGDNVADGAILAVAKFQKGDSEFQFKNAVGFLRVDIALSDVTEVIVRGTDISGTASFNELGELQEVTAGGSSVNLKPSGETFAAGSYYIALLPGTTAANGFSITMIRKSDKASVMTATKDIRVPKNGGFFVEDSKLTEAFVIKDAATLKTFLAEAKNYESTDYAIVVNDIDLKDETLTSSESFAGVLNGNGYSIKNWTSNGVSLFTELSGTVTGLNFDSTCSLTPADKAGAFGFLAKTVAASGVVDACVNNAAVTFNATKWGAGSDQSTDAVYFGTLVGQNNGKVQNSVNNGNLTLNSEPSGDDERGFTYIGGVVGLVDNGYLHNDANNGNISYSITGRGGFLFLGGVAGGTTALVVEDIESAVTKVDACINTGNIYHSFTQNIIGAGNAKSNYINMAGVIGYCEGSIVDCVNGVSGDDAKGKIQLDAPTLATGDGYSAARVAVAGISAYVFSTAKNCNNYGSIDVDGSFGPGYETYPGGGNKEDGGTFVAGVVAQIGAFDTADENHSIADCHNYGEMDVNLPITATSGTNYKNYHHVGGVVAYANAAATNLSNNAKIVVYSEGTMNYLGGAIGQTDCNATTIANNADVNYTIGRTGGNQLNNANQFFGGVLGYNTGDKMTSLVNNGNVTILVNNTNQKLRVGGVAGSFGNATDVTNNGTVKMTETEAHAKEVDFAGVAGATTSGVTSNIYNKGNVIYSGKAMTGSLYIAGVIGYASSSSHDNLYNEKPLSVSATEFGTGYVAGVIGSAGGSLTAVTNSNTITIDVPTIKTLYASGVVGAARSATEYSNVKNMSKVYAKAGATLYLAGVVGYSGGKVTFTDCENNGALEFDAPGLEATELNAAGICARPYAKAVYDKCMSSGTISIAAKSASKACYLGGIAAQTSNPTSAGNSYDVEDCTVTGDILVDCPATWYVGGAIAYGSQWSSTLTNHRIASGNTVECDITISSSTVAHHVGGIIGFSGVHTDICDNSYTGKISVGNNEASKLSNIGGVVGTLAISQTSATATMNAEFSLSNNIVDADIIYNATTGYAGMLVGAINNIASRTEFTNYSKISLDYDKDVVKNGSSINSVLMTSVNIGEYLMSDYDYTGRYELTISNDDTVVFE